MANDLDDAVGEMAEDFLAEAGESWSYIRGVTTYTVTMRRSAMRPVTLETNEGFIEVRPIDFIGLVSDMTSFYPPQRGDEITNGTSTYEVMPTTGEKCFRALSPKMVRIHTKQTE